MGRLRSFADYRFVGRRDQMLVYDCDNEDAFELLEAAVHELLLGQRNLLQAFAPDSIVEANNRGFRSNDRGSGVRLFDSSSRESP